MCASLPFPGFMNAKLRLALLTTTATAALCTITATPTSGTTAFLLSTSATTATAAAAAAAAAAGEAAADGVGMAAGAAASAEEAQLHRNTMRAIFAPAFQLPVNETSSSAAPQLDMMVHLLKVYFTPLLIVTGTVGNTLTSLTLCHRLMPKLSCYPYLLSLAIADTCFLVFLLLKWVRLMDPALLSAGGWCQASMFISYVCTFMAIWLCVCLSVDRFVVITLPTPFTKLVTPLRSRIVAIVVTIVAVVVYLNISVLYGEKTSTQGSETIDICIPLHRFLKTIQALGMADIFVNLLLPYTVIIVLNLVTLVKLVGHYRRRRIIIRTNDSRSRHVVIERRPKAEMQSTKMTMAVCWTFLCLNIPSNGLRLYGSFGPIGQNTIGMDRVWLFLQEVFLFLFFSRSALNFPLHFLSSEAFRRAFRALFWCRSRRKYIPNRTATTMHIVNGITPTSNIIVTSAM